MHDKRHDAGVEYSNPYKLLQQLQKNDSGSRAPLVSIRLSTGLRLSMSH